VRDPTAFTDRENWTGGFYELSLEIGDRDDDRLHRALTALWRATAIVGCYAGRDREPADQTAVPLTVASLREFGHLRGIAHPPVGGPVLCGCYSGVDGENPDWLTLYFPLGALARVERRVGAFPFGPDGGPESLRWRASLDAWLAEVANEVFHDIDFRLGLIGFELDYTTAADLDGVVPDQRWSGYLLPADGRLGYAPANK
jgi:hypothetical protein